MKINKEIRCNISEQTFKKSAQSIFESYKKQFSFANPTLEWSGTTAIVKFSVLFIKVQGSMIWYDRGLKISMDIPKGFEKHESNVMSIILNTVKQFDPNAAFVIMKNS